MVLQCTIVYMYVAGNFQGIQFLWQGHLQKIFDLIFADGRSWIENVRLSFLFHFHGLPVNRKKNRKDWIPRKDLAIWTFAEETFTNFEDWQHLRKFFPRNLEHATPTYVNVSARNYLYSFICEILISNQSVKTFLPRIFTALNVTVFEARHERAVFMYVYTSCECLYGCLEFGICYCWRLTYILNS